MALKDDIALLARIPVFKGLQEDHLRLLAFGAERRQLAAGEILFRQSSPADCAFVVTRGLVQLTSLGKGGAIEDAGKAGPGAMISEMAMIAKSDRRLTATVVDDTEVLRITRALFHRMVEEYPAVGKQVESRLRENFTAMASALAKLADRFEN